jgi:hypothetical protein
MIYGLINSNGVWRIRHNNELYTLYDELDIFKVIKMGRLRWLGHLFRMQELDPSSKLNLIKPEGTRRLGKPKLRWLASDEEHLKKVGMRNWRHKSQNREHWGAVVGRG